MAATADGSLGQALQASAGELVESRDVAQRVLEQAATQPTIRARRIESAKAAGREGAGRRRASAISWRRTCARWPSLLRDVELLADRRGRARAGERRRPSRARAARTALSRRARHAGVRGGRPRAVGAASATPASSWSPTGWCCSCEHRASRSACRGEADARWAGSRVTCWASEPAQAPPRPGDRVVVQTEGGPAVGTVVHAIPQLDEKRRPAERFAAARGAGRVARGHRRAVEASAPRAGGVSHRAAEDSRARPRHEARRASSRRSTDRS